MNPRVVRPAILLAAVVQAACAAAPEPGPVPRVALPVDPRFERASLGTVGPEDSLSLAGSAFSLTAGFVLARGGDPYARIIDKSDGPFGRNGWALGVDAESGRVHLYAHDGRQGADFVSRLHAIEPGRRHVVTAVARRDRYEIWIDGTRDRQATFETGRHVLPASRSTPAAIGRWNHAPGRTWNGRIDEIAVWARDLAPEEIEDLHAHWGAIDLGRRVGRYRSSGALVGWWRIEIE